MRTLVIARVFSVLALAVSAHAQTATLTMLPEEFEVYDLSGDGRVVVGWVTNVTPRYAATWTREAGVQPIPKPPSWGATLARAVNHDGTVIAGEAATPEGVRAFVYKPETGMVALGVLPGASSSISLGVSSSGEWTCGNSGAFPYRYHVPTGVMERLADPGYPNDSFNASAISNSGVVVGAAFSSKGRTADPYEWPTPNVAVNLAQTVGNEVGSADDVTPDGRWVLGHVDPPLGGGILSILPSLWDAERRQVPLLESRTVFNGGGYLPTLTRDGALAGGAGRVRGQPNWQACIWSPQSGMVLVTSVASNIFGLSMPSGGPDLLTRLSADGAVAILEWADGSRRLYEAVLEWPAPCAADCDLNWQHDIFDFLCFLNEYAEGHSYACAYDEREATGSYGGLCDVFDFLAFQRAFEGCGE